MPGGSAESQAIAVLDLMDNSSARACKAEA